MYSKKNNSVLNPISFQKGKLLAINTDNNQNDKQLFFMYQAGQVIEVVHEYNLEKGLFPGCAKVRLLHSQFDQDQSTLLYAKPLDLNNLKLPVVGQIVQCVYYPNTQNNTKNYQNSDLLYYRTVISVDNKITNNLMNQLSTTKESQLDTSVQNFTIQNQFKNNSKLQSITVGSGDCVISGRSGNFILFSSHEKQGLEPQLKIINTLTKENSLETFQPEIDNCTSIISFDSHTPEFVFPSNNFLSKENYTLPLTDCIIIKSGNLYLSSNQSDIILNSNKNILLSSNQHIGLNSKETIINSQEIKLGLEATQHLVLGETLVQIIGKLIQQIKLITVNTGVGVSTVPVNIAKFEAIKKQLSTILSKRHKVE